MTPYVWTPVMAYTSISGAWFTGLARPVPNHGFNLSMDATEARRFARTLWHHAKPTRYDEQAQFPVWTPLTDEMALVPTDWPFGEENRVGPNEDGRFEVGGYTFAWDSFVEVNDPDHPQGTISHYEGYRVAHLGASGWEPAQPRTFAARRGALRAAADSPVPARVVRTATTRMWAPTGLDIHDMDNQAPPARLPAWEDEGVYQTTTRFQVVDLVRPDRVQATGTDYARLTAGRDTTRTGMVLHTTQSHMDSTQLR